ncbi:MAG: hypothetical protein DRP81_09135, partial [Candidatus Omnitrophota bacterium]
QCITHGLVSGKHLTVDGSLVKANASLKSMEAVVVEMRPKEYIKRVEKRTHWKNPGSHMMISSIRD